MPKPNREPSGRNSRNTFPESKAEVESYLSKKRETAKQETPKSAWSLLPESLQEIEERRQKQYQDLQAKKENIIPTATGNMDAERAGYNRALAEYGNYWGDKAAYDEGFANYKAALDRLNGQYDSHAARHLETDKMVDERIARTSGMQGAGNRMTDADRRFVRDTALYNRMGKDANTAGDYALYQRAAQGYNKTVSDYATNYSQAQSDYWDAAKTEQPGYYYANTMSADEVDAKLEELRATREKLHENLMGVLSDIDNNPHTPEERQRLSDTKYRIQDRYTNINNEIDYLETAKGLHKQRRGDDMYNYWLNEGGLEKPENYAKVEQGKAKYEADQLAASGGMKEPEIATPAGGAIKAYRNRNQKENEWDNIFDNAPNLTPSDEMVFYALYADDPEQAMEWAYYINNRRNSEFQGEMAEFGYEHPGWAWLGGLGNRMISGVANFVDPNSAFAQKQSLQSTGLMSGGAQALNEWSGTIDTDIPIIKDLFNGKGAGDFYQLASSIAESGINMAVASYTGDAAKLVGALGTFIMGSSAAAADYNESLQRGLTTAQAQRHALAAGINEAAFEFISLDKVIKADKLAGQLKKVFVDAGIEASEEFCTTVANRIADGYLARQDGYDTQIEQRTKELIALGLSRAEAEAQAEREWRVELINDAIGGFISGGFHAGIEWGGGKVANKIATNQNNEIAGVWTDADEIAALRAYADENGIKYNEKALRGMEAVETEESGPQSAVPTTENGGQQTTVSTETSDADSSPTAQNDNGETTETKQSRREARQERKSNRATGALQTQVEAHIAKAAHESGLNNAQAFFDQTVSRYGEGITRTAQNAVAHEARSVFGQAKNQTELKDLYQKALEGVTSEPIKQTIKEVYQSATTRLAYRGDNEALRDALIRPGSGGKLNLAAEITGKDGSTQQVRIASLDAERGKVKLDNGETVALNELQGLDADTKDVIERLDRFDLGDTRALAFHSYLLAAAKGDVTDGVRFVMEYALAYDQGRNGVVSLEKAAEQSSLPADIVQEAYEHGARQTETWRKDQERRNAEKRAKAKDGATGRNGILDSSRISQEKLDKLSADKKDALRTFELLAEASGVDIRLIAQNADEEGNVRGYQGLYNKDGNYIEIDINAGLNNIFKDLHTGMTAVLGHELTHWMQENAPTEYLAYKKAVLKAIMSTKNGQLRLERMIEAQINQNKREGKEIGRSQAEDEIVADASMKRLGDSEFWDAVSDNLGEKKADVFAKIKEYISQFFNRVREIIGRASHTSEAAKLIDRVEADVQATLRRLYAEGIGAAMRNSAQTGTETKNAATDGGSYSTRSDTAYLAAVERGDMEAAQKMVDEAADQWGAATDEHGKPIPLYHGTPRFGFTVFKDPAHEVPFIYTSTNPTVSAHYAGDKNYAGRRPIGRKYRTGTKTEDIIENAKWVYESNYHVMSTEEKLKAYKEIEKQAIEIADKLDEVHIGAWNAESESFKNMPDEVANAISWVEDMFWTIRDSDYKFNFDGKEDYPGERAEFFKVLDSDIENAKTQRAIVQEFYDENRKNLSKQEKAFLSYLLSYEVGDAAIDIEYKLRRVATENDVIMNEAGNINNPLDLKESMDMYHETGAYTLYGNLGDNPFIFDANGAQFWGVKVPEMGDGYYSTDSISKWAYENGYTGVVMKNIYDYGDKADNYVFFNSSQLKSADPVTYDDSGKVIPLSERFNPEKEDIRYSTRAQEQRDEGKKLSESKFYSLYSAHKLNMTGRGNVQEQIASIMEDGFKGDGGFGNNVMPTNISYDVDENGKRIPRGLSAQKYAPKKGEYILLVPKEGVEVKGSRYNFTERVKPGYKPAFDYEIVQADYDGQPYYEMYEKAYDAAHDVSQYSTRDYSDVSDLDLLLNAANEISDGGGDAYWASLLESDPGIAGEAEEIKRLGKQLKKTEADLAEARRNLTLTDRKLKTRGIASLAATIMQDQKAGDVNHNDVQKQITAVLTEAYQKALDQLDAGADASDAWETVYQEGVVKAADILLRDSTHSEKISYKWYTKTLGEYLGEGAREYVEAEVAARVAQDFDANRYRPGQKATVADRLVAQAESRASKKLDAAKTENAALKAENAKLSEDKAFYKEQAETAKATAGELYQQLLDKREELKNNKKISADERKATLKKLDNMTRQMQAKRREAEVWKSKSEIGWKAANKAVQEKQAAVDKLEKQLQREQDILSGKLKPPAIQKMLKAAREREAERVAQQKDERFAKYKEGKKASDLRKRIKNLSDDMKRTMVKPTDGSYVPASLYGSMTKLADALDELLAPNEGTKAAGRYRAVMDQIHALSSEYQAVANLDDPVYSSEYDEEIQHEINELVRTLQGANADEVGTLNMTQAKARELTVDELQKVYDIMKYINYCMKTAKSMMASGTFRSVYDAMGQIAEQQQSMTSLNRLGWYSKKKRLRMLDSLSVMRAVEMMSGWERSAALYQLMQQIENGVDGSNAWVMEYNKALQTLKTGKNEKAYRDALTKKLDYSVTDEEGLPVLMTKMQALQLLMTAEREAHNDKLVHLQKGGATIRDALAIQDGKKNVKSQNIKVTPDLIQTIQDSLSEWDKAYMKAIRDYFKREGKATNNVMYKLKHRVLQTEDYYVPYVVDKNYLDTNLDEKQAMSMWVKTPGSTNTLQKKASQPVIIDGMDTVMAKHVREIADYVGLALPIRDFSKVYNGRLKQGEDENPLPVKQTIGKNFGEKGQHLLTQSIIDVQGGGRGTSWSTAIAEHLNALQSAFVKSALLVNPSVTIKQAASYAAAGSILSHAALDRANHPISVKTDESNAFDPATGLIGHIFFAPNGATATRIYNEIDKHTSLHYQRRLGMSQAELANEANRSGKVRRAMNSVGASMEQNVFGHAARKVGASLNPVSWIQRMDVATTATLWLACKEQARMDGMKVGTEEYWNHVTELYERVIRETQPMYDSLHRNAGQKSRENSLMQYLFPFRTVPIQNHGQIAASYETLQAALKSKDEARIKQAKKFFAKTMWAQTESAIIFSLMTFIAAALKRKTKKYRDEDEEISLASILEGIGRDTAGTMVSNFFPLFGSTIWDELGNIYDAARTGKKVWSYDTFSVGTVDMMNDFAKASWAMISDAFNWIAGNDVTWDKFSKDAENLVVKSLKCIGFPSSTIKTYVEGFVGNLKDVPYLFSEGRIPALNDASWERSAAVNANRYLKAWIADDDAKLETVKAEMIGNYKEAGKDEEEANKAMKTKLTATAKDAFAAGTLDETDAILFLAETGYYDENEAWLKVKEWRAENEHADDEDYSWSKYEDLYAAMDSDADIEPYRDELESHGVKADTIKNAVVDHVKERYEAGKIDADEAMRLLQKYKGMSENDAYWKVDAWDAKEEAEANGEKATNSNYRDLYAAIDANADASAAIQELTEHGYKERDVYSAAKDHLVERFEKGEINETQFKNQLSRYAKIVKQEDVDPIVNNSKCYKETGYRLGSLNESYLDGEITAEKYKQIRVKYGGKTAEEAKKQVRWLDLKKAHPDLDITESVSKNWYDGTTKSRENGHESAKAAGMSIEAYLKAKATLDEIKDSNDNGTGEDEVIAAIAKMNLTARQKDALYYERYKGGARKGIYKTW